MLQHAVIKMQKQNIDALINLAIRRNLVIPSFSVYGEMSGFYDLGPEGTRIRNNIVSAWRRYFIDGMGNAEIDTTIVGPEKVFEASGHLEKFFDYLSYCKDCKTSYRIDKVLEEHFESKGDTASIDRLKSATAEELDRMVKENGINCDKCGGELGPAEPFNLMLQTGVGPKGAVRGYLRPETAQSIFLDFKKIFSAGGMKLPIGIGTVGKAFRNEISPRRMLIRLREFSQMELEYFFDAEAGEIIIDGNRVDDAEFMNESINLLTREDQLKGRNTKAATIKEALDSGVIPNRMFAYLVFKYLGFVRGLGFKDDMIRFRQALPEELPHYSKGNIDVEASIGGRFEEITGIAYRTDFDLSNHQKYSGADMSVSVDGKKVMPHVVEISTGIERTFWTLLFNSHYFDEERGWDVVLLNKGIAPYDYAVFPLQKDEKLIALARKVLEELKAKGISAYYSSTGSIGKRYARADEVGVRGAITVDYQSLEDNTVTVRGVADAKQARKKIEEIS